MAPSKYATLPLVYSCAQPSAQDTTTATPEPQHRASRAPAQQLSQAPNAFDATELPALTQKAPAEATDAPARGNSRTSLVSQVDSLSLSSILEADTTPTQPSPTPESVTLASPRLYGQSLLRASFALPGSEKLCKEPFVPIILAIDIEMYEWNNQEEMTEIGFASLDTRLIDPTNPGPHGSNWCEHAAFHHLRIREYCRRENRTFSPGNPDKYDFGTSEWVTIDEAKKAMDHLLNVPGRDVVVIFHDDRNDKRNIAHCLKIAVSSYGTVYGTLDTQTLDDPRDRVKLSTLVSMYGMSASHLHNAGNDAAYTFFVAIRQALEFACLDSSFDGPPAPDDVIASVQRLAHRKAQSCRPLFGVRKFCKRCLKARHNEEECRLPDPRQQTCDRCGLKRHPTWHDRTCAKVVRRQTCGKCGLLGHTVIMTTQCAAAVAAATCTSCNEVGHTSKSCTNALCAD